LLLLAAAGVYALYDAMTNDSAVKEYNAKIDEMIKKLDTLTSRQAEVVASELQARLVKNNQEISKLKDQISETKRMLDLASSSSSPEMKGAIESGQAILRKLETNLNSAMEAQIRMNGELKRAEKATKENTNVDNERSAALEVFNSVAKGAVSSNKLLAKTIELGSPAAASMAIELSLLEKQLLDSGVSAEEAERQVSNFRNILEANKSMDFELMLQGIEENVQALKIEMEEGKDAAIEYLATVQMAKAGISDDGMLDRLISGLREQHALQTKISNGKKKGSGGKKDKAGDELKRQQNEVAALNKRFELLSTGVADANRDMAMFEAVQKLGSKATNKQKEAAEKEAAEIYDLTQKVNDFIRAQEATPELKLAREFGEEAKTIRRMFDEGFIDKETFTRLGREATQAFEQGMSDIRIETTSNNIITDIGENRAKFDPIQALANENTRKLAMMKEYYDQEQKLLSDSYATQKMTHEQYTAAKSATDMQYHMLITAMDKQYQQQQLAAQWELMRQQNLGYEMLASAVDSLAGNASNVITGLMTGTMSAADAMRSLGNTILNSVVNSIVQVGVEMLKNFILDQTIRQSANAANILAANAAGAAALAAWTPAAIAASIATGGAASATGLGAFKTSMLSGQAMSMVGLAGARYNGGPVNAGEMYRVGEHGKPEIFKASTGKQYMIPGDNGRVISNKDMQGSGSSMPPIINVYQQASGAAVDVTTEKGLNAQDVVNIVVRNIMEGREISGAVSTHHNAPRKAVGSL
nr:hypothetical protein [Providencia rettgeri]